MARGKSKRSSHNCTRLVGFNPPPAFSSLESGMPFASYRHILETYYKLKVRIGVPTAYSTEVKIGEFPATGSMPVTWVMLGSRCFAFDYDGIELYLLQSASNTRMPLCSLNEVTPGYLNFVLNGVSTVAKRLNVVDSYPQLINNMVLDPLFPPYTLEYVDESKVPFRLLLSPTDWVPVKTLQGERVSVQRGCSVVDSPSFPARVGQQVPEAHRWNKRYLGSSKAKHYTTQLSELHAVEVREVLTSVEAKFDPDSNLDD